MACSIQIWRFDLASRSASACCLAWSVNESAMPSLLLGGVRTSRNMILAEILDALLVSRSELTIAINNAFKEAGIQIPFPQQDVHLHWPDGSVPGTGRIAQREGSNQLKSDKDPPFIAEPGGVAKK